MKMDRVSDAETMKLLKTQEGDRLRECFQSNNFAKKRIKKETVLPRNWLQRLLIIFKLKFEISISDLMIGLQT
jgi:hypothetical protein